jgi:hypothetical protein
MMLVTDKEHLDESLTHLELPSQPIILSAVNLASAWLTVSG